MALTDSDRVACFCEKCTTRGLKYTFVSRKTRYNHERDSRIDFKQKRQEYKKEMGDRKRNIVSIIKHG